MNSFMRAIATGLSILARFTPQAMVAGVVIGLLAPGLAEYVRPFLTPAVWGLLFVSLLRVDWLDLKAQLKRPVFACGLVFWMLVATPVLMAVLLHFTDFRPGLEAAMVLAAASSSLFSTMPLGLIFGLDSALLLVVLIGGTMLVPLTLPLAALLLLGFDMGADPLVLMARMGVLVSSAVAAAVGVRWLCGEARVYRCRGGLDGVAVVLLIGFAIGIMDGLTARILADPWDIAMIAGLAFGAYTGLMIFSYGFFAVAVPGVGRRGALSACFISGTRNLAIILAVLPESVDSDLPLFFAVGQFPIYIMPMLLKPVFRRLLKPAR